MAAFFMFLSLPAANVPAQCTPQQAAKLTAADAGAADLFGNSVAISGDTAVVGAYFDDFAGLTNAGSAYVFVRAAGVWTQQAKLTASDAATDDYFGWSVAIAGDTVVIGAYRDDHAGGSDAGSAYVFVRTGGTWIEQAKLTASDAAFSDDFGWSVAVSDDTVVVGALFDNQPGGIDGGAYVFVRSGGVWTQQAKLVASDGVTGDQLGRSVAISADTAMVGAWLDDNSGGTDAGSAYVFVRSGGVWTQQAKLIASDAEGNEAFGYSVALSGDTGLIGAHGDDNAGGVDAGAVYVFVRAGIVWTEQAKLTASDGAEGDDFGESVSLSGDTAVIGAYQDDPAGATDGGTSYVFTRSSGMWTQQAKLIASDVAASDQFGWSVAVSGDTAVNGARLATHPGGSFAGAAYIFDLQCSPVCCTGDFDGNFSVDAADLSGFCAALVSGMPCPAPPTCCPGDMNGDGVIDGLDIAGFLAKLFSGGVCP